MSGEVTTNQNIPKECGDNSDPTQTRNGSQESIATVTNKLENTTLETNGAATDGSSSELTNLDSDQSCSLFIGDINKGVGEGEIRELFSTIGTVVKVDIKKDRITGNNLGYGFVTMSNIEEAQRCKKELNNHFLLDKHIRIGWAQQNTNLFIGDLGGEVDDNLLRTVFRKFGSIYENDTFVKHGNYGFVRFKNRIDAETAKREMNGKEIVAGSGKVIRIGWGDSNTQKQTVHFKFDLSDFPKITKQFVESVFGQFGEIQNITLPQKNKHIKQKTEDGEQMMNIEYSAETTPKHTNQKGFGFVHYQDSRLGEVSAAEAIEAVNGKSFDGVVFQCSFGKRKPYSNNSGNSNQHHGGHYGKPDYKHSNKHGSKKDHRGHHSPSKMHQVQPVSERNMYYNPDSRNQPYMYPSMYYPMDPNQIQRYQYMYPNGGMDWYQYQMANAPEQMYMQSQTPNMDNRKPPMGQPQYHQRMPHPHHPQLHPQQQMQYQQMQQNQMHHMHAQMAMQQPMMQPPMPPQMNGETRNNIPKSQTGIVQDGYTVQSEDIVSKEDTDNKNGSAK